MSDDPAVLAFVERTEALLESLRQEQEKAKDLVEAMRLFLLEQDILAMKRELSEVQERLRGLFIE